MLRPMVYFSFLNEDSIPHLESYNALICSGWNSSRGRFVRYIQKMIHG